MIEQLLIKYCWHCFEDDVAEVIHSNKNVMVKIYLSADVNNKWCYH